MASWAAGVSEPLGCCDLASILRWDAKAAAARPGQRRPAGASRLRARVTASLSKISVTMQGRSARHLVQHVERRHAPGHQPATGLRCRVLPR